MAVPLVDAVPWWLVVVLSTTVLAATVAVYLPFLHGGKLRKQAEDRSQRKGKASDKVGAQAAGPEVAAPVDDGCALDEEPWIPKFEIRPWKEASQLPGCPWNFDSCNAVQDVLERIWRAPLHSDLQLAFEALIERVKNVQVARMSQNGTVHFAIVYTLKSGAELFGGEPVDHAVGVELGDEDDHDDDSSTELPVDAGGLRQRRGPGSLRRGRAEAAEDSAVPFPCVLPFYCVHDGFGVLASVKHLPLLLGAPEDSVHGSCFYIYPLRGFEQVLQRDHLVKFARVDKHCVACLDVRRSGRSIVYLERSGEEVDDEEHPMSFMGDTVRNVCGDRVVPPSYMGGPSPHGPPLH